MSWLDVFKRMIGNVTVSNNASSGKGLVASSSTAASWVAIFDRETPGTIGGAVAGDIYVRVLRFRDDVLDTAANLEATTDQFIMSFVARLVTAGSQEGRSFRFTAENATAGNATPGAANGGDLLFRTGDAAQYSSGDARAGIFKVTLGEGVGAGAGGEMQVYDQATGETPFKVDSDGAYSNGVRVNSSHEVFADGVCTTSDATPGTVAFLETETDTNYTLEIEITGRRRSDGQIYSHRQSFWVRNVADVVTSDSLINPASDEDYGTYNPMTVGNVTRITVDEVLYFQVTGLAATLIDWVCVIRGVKIASLA